MAKTKKYKVVIIPSNEETINNGDIVLCHAKPEGIHSSIVGTMAIWNNNSLSQKERLKYYKPQHIYFISDEEINGKMISNGSAIFIKTEDAYYKCVATTNKKFTPESWIDDNFKNIFVKSFSAGNPITEIELELEPEFTGHNEKNPKNQVPKTHQDGSLFLTDKALK